MVVFGRLWMAVIGSDELLETMDLPAIKKALFEDRFGLFRIKP
jgi:hypothetical protein